MMLDEDVNDAVAFYFDEGLVITESNIFGLARCFVVGNGVKDKVDNSDR